MPTGIFIYFASLIYGFSVFLMPALSGLTNATYSGILNYSSKLELLW